MSKEPVVVIPAFNEENTIAYPLFRLHLESVRYRCGVPIPVVVVDNGSTDQTKQVVKDLGRDFEGIDVHLLDELEKGTGCAVDTGFRHAIENMGAEIIARTDADARPLPPWYTTLTKRHEANPNIHLLTGPVIPSTPLDPDNPDRIMKIRMFDLHMEWPVINAKRITRIVRAIKYVDPAFIYAFAPGYNMSTTALAYKETGGFPRASIDDIDEDVAYNIRVGEFFGFRSKKFDRNMWVEHSIRRERELGYLRSALHYAISSKRRGGQSDIR